MTAIEDRETAAHRKAISEYARILQEELGRDSWFGLAGTGHQHKSVSAEPDGRAMMVTVRITFSEVIATADLEEVIALHTGNPRTWRDKIKDN